MSEEVKRAIAEVIARPELRERCAKAALDAAWYDADGHGWVDEARVPDGVDISSVECGPVLWDYATEYWRKNGRRIAAAVIAEVTPSREAIRAAIASGYTDKMRYVGERVIDLDAAADAVMRVIASAIAGGDE